MKGSMWNQTWFSGGLPLKNPRGFQMLLHVSVCRSRPTDGSRLTVLLLVRCRCVYGSPCVSSIFRCSFTQQTKKLNLYGKTSVPHLSHICPTSVPHLSAESRVLSPSVTNPWRVLATLEPPQNRLSLTGCQMDGEHKHALKATMASLR